MPLTSLPIAAATAAFTIASLAVFAATVAWLVGSVLRAPLAATPTRRLALAALAGVYPPVVGTVFAGQANLLVLGLLAVGAAPFVGSSSRVHPILAGLADGLAAVVKLVPFALAAPFVLAWPRRDATLAFVGLVLGSVGALIAAVAVAPSAAQGASSLEGLFASDAFHTNASLNGAISRLLLDGDRTVRLVAGDPTVPVIVATGTLAVATLAVLAFALLRRSRGDAPSSPGAAGAPVATAPDASGASGVTRRTLALGIALALVAATVGAPKNSFWNHAPLLLAFAIAVVWGLLDDRRNRALVAAWIGATVVQVCVDVAGVVVAPLPAVVTPLADAGVVAALALWVAIARTLLASSSGRRPGRRMTRRAPRTRVGRPRSATPAGRESRRTTYARQDHCRDGGRTHARWHASTRRGCWGQFRTGREREVEMDPVTTVLMAVAILVVLQLAALDLSKS